MSDTMKKYGEGTEAFYISRHNWGKNVELVPCIVRNVRRNSIHWVIGDLHFEGARDGQVWKDAHLESHKIVPRDEVEVIDMEEGRAYSFKRGYSTWSWDDRANG